MDSNKRLLITVAACFAIAIAFHFLYPILAGEPPKKVAPKPAEVAAVPEAPKPEAPAAPGPAEAPPGAPAVAAVPETAPVLRTPELELGFSSRGAGLSSAKLLGEKNRRSGKDGEQIDLAGRLGEADARLFEVALGGGLPALPTRAPCALASSDETQVTFRCEGPGVAVTKRFELGAPPVVSLKVKVENLGSAAVDGTVDLLAFANVDPAKQSGSGGGCASPLSELPNPTEAVCRAADEVERHKHDTDEPRVKLPGRAWYAGFAERYFLAVAVPHAEGGLASCTLVGETPTSVGATLSTPTGPIPPGGSKELAYDLVIGAKDAELLEEVSGKLAPVAGGDPDLETAVDLGMWAVIARLLLVVMKFFHALIPNWGVAIVLLTVTVKAITFPLAWKSMKSMEGMRKLTPEIEALKKKYGEDKEKLNLEMLQLWQKHKVNPFGGCVPILIQMPVWIALYTTLQTSVELYNEPFIGGWIADLTTKDPYYALPLAMGITMFMTQKMQPAATMDPAQQKMMLYMMPIMFTGFMLQLPAGLTLYMFTNNILSIAQQLALRKVMGMPLVGPPTAVPVTPAEPPKKKGKGS